MRLRLRIGPATLDALADCLPEDVGRPNYVPFLCDATPASRPDVTLRIRMDAPPARGDAHLIHELPRNWALYSQGGGYRLEVMEQITFQPRQIVLLRRELNDGDVYTVPDPLMPEEAWSLASLMSPFVQWWLAAWLAIRRAGLVVHASAVSMNGAGLAFVGPSGAGKTTMARWCQARAGAVVLNDERIILSRGAAGFEVSGTPWHGEWAELSAGTAPLAALCVLQKAEANCFERLSPASTIARVVPESFLPIWSIDAMHGLLETAERAAREVPSGELRFANDWAITDYLLEYLDGKPTVTRHVPA